MINAMENLLTRRSIRKYKGDMVDKQTIERIVEAGTYAANAMGYQLPIIVAVTNKETRDKLSADNCKIGGFPEGMDPFYGAPVVLIVLAPAEFANKVYDGSCVMQNLMLAAHAEGVGSCWIHRAKEEFEMPEWKQWLKEIGVEGEYEGIGHCILGYADCEEPMAAARKDGRVYWDC